MAPYGNESGALASREDQGQMGRASLEGSGAPLS